MRCGVILLESEDTESLGQKQIPQLGISQVRCSE